MIKCRRKPIVYFAERVKKEKALLQHGVCILAKVGWWKITNEKGSLVEYLSDREYQRVYEIVD